MNVRLRPALLWLVLVAAVALVPLSDSRAQTAQTRQVMRQKLELSQGLLAGLVTSNWSALGKDSRALASLTMDPGWAVLREPEYARQTVDFLRSADALVDATARRDQAATLVAYNNLVASCVQCHRYVARARLARVWSTAQPRARQRADPS